MSTSVASALEFPRPSYDGQQRAQSKPQQAQPQQAQPQQAQPQPAQPQAQPQQQQQQRQQQEEDQPADPREPRQLIGERHIGENAEEPGPDPAERAMVRAQVRAQAFVNRASSSDTLSEPKQWPPLARKKSGELVKSSLRSRGNLARPELTRTKSEPMRKAVHFNQKLEDVRPFRKTQRPSAINPEGKKPRFSTGSSSSEGLSDGTDNDDDDDDDDDDDHDDDESGWTLLTPGFAPHRFSGVAGAQRPVVYLDALQLNGDKSAVNGTIYVRNLAFGKHVAVRYTMDSWNTFSETKAVWNDDVRKHDRDAGYDRFDMTLPLRCFSPLVLCDTVMFLCVRYNVNGEEFWDNNNGANYELYLRNSELLHSLSAQKKKAAPSVSSNTRPGLGRSASAGPIEKTDSVKEILKSSMLDLDDKPGLAGPPGIPMKRHSGANKSRYSFEASYAMPPQAPSDAREESAHGRHLQPRYNAFAAQQLARSWMPQEAAVPMPAKLKDSERVSTGAALPRITSEQPPTHTWESQSYKDFVSKYCFYTPTPKSAHKKALEESSHIETSRDGSPENALSSAESSDVDLTTLRRDLPLAPQRETNRV